MEDTFLQLLRDYFRGERLEALIFIAPLGLASVVFSLFLLKGDRGQFTWGIAVPFFVLGLSPDASRLEIEREAQKLLGMIGLEFANALTYATPVGPRPRTAETVRAAVAALRDPYQRLVAELWARHAPDVTSEAPPEPSPHADARRGLRRALGWRP